MGNAENNEFVYEFGKFVLDPKERTLFADSIPMHLPAKEFDTLLLLVENNRKALRKEEMMSAIWQDSFVEESNLAKQISLLRKILNTNGNEYIETIPKHGYRFSADLRRVVSNDDSVVLEKRTVKRVKLTFEDEAEPANEPQHLHAPKRRFLTVPIIAAVAVLALVGIAAIWLWNKQVQPASTKINTIAVLPLRSLNGDEDNKALGLGLTDALITKLGSMRRVIVRPTNAVAPFGNESDPVDAGRRLGVDAVLEGSVQRADGRLRVNARLLHTNTGEQIWSDSFDQPIGEIFALQDALSANIAKTLAFELSRSDNDRLLRRGTENADAYERYLRGRFYQGQNTPSGLNRSIELYQQSIALDPNFAEAHAGIADANVLLFNFGFRSADETIPQARQSLNRALLLDPELSSAYTSLALIQFLSDRDWSSAEMSLKRAIELDPNNADAFLRYGYFLINIGRFDEALEKLAQARELNPLSPIVQSNTGLAYLCARRYQEAIEQLEKTAVGNPQFSFPLWLLGTAYEAAGDTDKAFETNLRALEIDGDKTIATSLRKARDTNGLDAANRLWFDELLKARRSKPETVGALIVAMRAATAKDHEQTLYWLERAVEEGDQTLAVINYLSKFDFVREDPRFQDLVKKLPF